MKELLSGYKGRGILVGECDEGRFFAYFITGRSANSKNRIFVKEGENVKILPHKPELVEDPSLIIYYPVKVCGGDFIVTNGDQTDTIVEFGGDFQAALNTREFEPDAPNFTPRISAICKKSGFEMSILKEANGACERLFYDFDYKAGEARFLCTYSGALKANGGLESFVGEPKVVACKGSFAQVVSSVWNGLEAEFKISLYARVLDGSSEVLLNANR